MLTKSSKIRNALKFDFKNLHLPTLVLPKHIQMQRAKLLRDLRLKEKK